MNTSPKEDINYGKSITKEQFIKEMKEIILNYIELKEETYSLPINKFLQKKVNR